MLTGWRAKARIAFDVAPSAFVPPPKVTSSVVHIVPRPTPLPCERRALERITEAAFGQRRKMLRQSLKSLGVEAGALLEAADVEPTARAEEIPVEGFVALANAWVAMRGCKGPPHRSPFFLCSCRRARVGRPWISDGEYDAGQGHGLSPAA